MNTTHIGGSGDGFDGDGGGRDLSESLKAAARHAPTAPGLFDAVAERSRSRAVRVRVASSAFATIAVLGIATGVVSATSSRTDGTSADKDGGHASACPAKPMESVTQRGSADELITGTPTGATLCRFGYAHGSGPLEVTPTRFTGSALASLVAELREEGVVPGDAMCTEMRILPTSLLIFDFADRPSQATVIDLSGCGTVSNGNRSQLIPADVRALLKK